MNYNNNNKNTMTVSGGCGFCGLLTIAFIVLKLCGIIDWSWFLVLLPMIISVSLAVIIFIVALIIIAIQDR